MDALLIAVAIAATGGATVAVAVHVPRQAALGLLVALVVSPLLADRADRSVARPDGGAVLAVALVWIALRDAPGQTRGSLIGWPAEILAALAAFIAGWLLAGALGTSSTELGGCSPTVRRSRSAPRPGRTRKSRPAAIPVLLEPGRAAAGDRAAAGHHGGRPREPRGRRRRQGSLAEIALAITTAGRRGRGVVGGSRACGGDVQLPADPRRDRR